MKWNEYTTHISRFSLQARVVCHALWYTNTHVLFVTSSLHNNNNNSNAYTRTFAYKASSSFIHPSIHPSFSVAAFPLSLCHSLVPSASFPGAFSITFATFAEYTFVYIISLAAAAAAHIGAVMTWINSISTTQNRFSIHSFHSIRNEIM